MDLTGGEKVENTAGLSVGGTGTGLVGWAGTREASLGAVLRGAQAGSQFGGHREASLKPQAIGQGVTAWMISDKNARRGWSPQSSPTFGGGRILQLQDFPVYIRNMRLDRTFGKYRGEKTGCDP